MTSQASLLLRAGLDAPDQSIRQVSRRPLWIGASLVQLGLLQPTGNHRHGDQVRAEQSCGAQEQEAGQVRAGQVCAAQVRALAPVR